MTINKRNLVTFPKGHLFFHGTSSIFNFTTPKNYSWFSAASPGQAELAAAMYRQLQGKFGQSQPRQGIDRVLVYRAKKPVTLLVLGDDSFVRFAKKHGFKPKPGKKIFNLDYAPFVCRGTKGVADGMSHGRRGRLFGGGSFTMLCNPSNTLEYVRMYRPRRSTNDPVFGPLYDPTRVGRKIRPKKAG